MTTGNEDYSRHSPDKMLEVFSKGRMLYWLFVAAGIHLVVMLITSTGYIRDEWIDPAGAEARKQAAEAAEAAGAKETTDKGESPATDDGSGSAGTAAAGSNKPVVIDGEVVPDSATNASVIKRITEVAKPEDLPTEPDLGISLEDTRVQ